MRMPDGAYRPHENLVATAREKPQIWRLVLGLVVAGFVTFFAGFAMRTVLGVVSPDLQRELLNPANGEGNTPLTLLLLLFSFGFVILGIFVAARLVQQRSPLSMIGPLPLAIRQFLRVAVLVVMLGILVMILPPYDMGEPLESNLPVGIWLALLPISLLAVLTQVASEEILFRGYIQQSLAARFRSPLVWMVVPAILFGIGHYVPAQAGANAALIAVWAFGFGVMAADITARAGTLGPAIALHMINNVTAILIVSVPDSLSGLALATTPFSLSETENLRSWMLVDFGFIVVSWLAARLAIRR